MSKFKAGDEVLLINLTYYNGPAKISRVSDSGDTFWFEQNGKEIGSLYKTSLDMYVRKLTKLEKALR